MIFYLYDKYDTIQETNYALNEVGRSSHGSGSANGTFSSYKIESGKFVGVGSYGSYPTSGGAYAYAILDSGGNNVKTSPGTKLLKIGGGAQVSYTLKIVYSNIKKSFVQTIIGEENEYPLDGSHTDNYWYIRRESIISKYLFQIENEIKKYEHGSWVDIGVAPATKNMFSEHGMDDISSIPTAELNDSMKLISWTDKNMERKIIVATPKSLYDTASKAYKGIGIIETEAEALDKSRSTLIATADHKEAVFHYSLNDGANWKAFNLEEMISIKNEEGNLLKIKVELPTTTATLSALSYAWA